MPVDTIHSLNELPEAQHKLLKSLYLNADNLLVYFIFTLNIRFWTLSKNKKNNTLFKPDILCHQVSLDCILKRYQLNKRLLVGHNRPYGQPFLSK